VNFEEYLLSKKIDEVLFKERENNLWAAWKQEFSAMHPSSFTSQKLYLINPIRRKYPLKIELKARVEVASTEVTPVISSNPAKPTIVKPTMAKPAMTKPVVAKPVTSAPIKTDEEKGAENNSESSASEPTSKPIISKPVMPRPVFKPKPKTE